MKQYSGIIFGVIVFAILYWKQEMNRVHIIEQAQAKIKLHELIAKQYQDSIVKFKARVVLLTQEISILAHENDSLSRKESVIVNRIIHLPAIEYRPGQLDSIWRKRYRLLEKAK